MGSTSHQRSPRLLYVDLLRLVMTFQMVQGHSIDAILTQEARTGALYDGWSWVRGLTSVGFLFAAGVSFHLATLARFEAHRADHAAVRRRFRRGAQLVLIGYLLHFPLGALSGDAEAVRRALADFAIVDVLQCIGVCILALEGMTLLFRRAWHVTAAAAVLAVALVALAPVLSFVQPTGAMAPLANYVTHAGGSIFPLFPWAGYLFAGVVCGAAASTERTVAPARLLAVGAAIAGLAWLADLPGVFKLGAVVLLAAGLAGVGATGVRLPDRARVIAAETLAIYVVHIVLLYGAPWGASRLIGPTVSPWGSVLVAALFVALSVAVGLLWNRIKRARAHAGLRSGRAPA